MGLDNGIVLMSKKPKENFLGIKEEYDWLDIDILDRPYDERHKDFTAVDICYWRKCWNIRSDIFRIITPESDNDSRTELSVSDIDKIIDVLISYIKQPIGWDQSIWTFNEIKFNLTSSIANLAWLKMWLIDNPKDYAYFYDSY